MIWSQMLLACKNPTTLSPVIISLSRSWVVPELFLRCSWEFPELFLSCFWVVPEVFLSCFWVDPELFLRCFWVDPELFLSCAWVSSDLLPSCSWSVSELLLSCTVSAVAESVECGPRVQEIRRSGVQFLVESNQWQNIDACRTLVWLLALTGYDNHWLTQ